MRHVFIINPAAGKNRGAVARVPQIQAFFAEHKEFGTPEIVYTEKSGHATTLARDFAQTGEPVRLYACGGDGTVSEVLQGMYSFRNAQLAIFPCGSANDYIRSFPEYDFHNLAALVSGTAHDVDLIHCDDRVSLNIACMGMDADVAAKMVKYKHWPLVTGPMAYNLAIIDVFCHRIGKDLSITLQTPHGEVKREGRYFFALAASGQYYGGGYRGAPHARPDDGMLDFVLVKAISRLKVLRFLPNYKKGKVDQYPFVESFRGTAMTVHCDEGAVVSLDGECFTSTDLSFTLHEHPVAFVLPQQAVVQDPIDTHPAVKAPRKPRLKGAYVKKL